MKIPLTTLVALSAIIFVSCQKETKEIKANKQVVAQTKGCGCENEIAFPELGSEVIKISKNGATITVEKKGDYYVYGGDVLLTKEQFEKLKAPANGNRTAINNANSYWPNKIVYYTINSSLPNQARVTGAIANWEANTPLRFVQRTNQRDYVEFVPGSGCSSYIGKIGGRQPVTLASGCSTGSTIHEIGHAIGFFHEQSRTDRDNSIIINFANIQDGLAFNFQTYAQQNIPGFQLSSLDFQSIMMYGSYAFSKNGQPTITKLDGSTFTTNRTSLSPGDIETARFIYNR
jgi:Astacin (Peptidase family M12A)